ncbi:MAG: nucleotidyltransferase domain-containing protein [Gammaproteobacteria bacterium]|nr:nucleotidyltransferase domain-containing protein [Gammaproteobacteria bacterium]
MMKNIEDAVISLINLNYNSNVINWYGITGSHARSENREWSDVDVVLCVNDMESPYEEFLEFNKFNFDITIIGENHIDRLLDIERRSCRATLLTKLAWLMILHDPKKHGERAKNKANEYLNSGSAPERELLISIRLNLTSAISAAKKTKNLKEQRLAALNLFFKMHLAHTVNANSWVGITPFMLNYHSANQDQYISGLLQLFFDCFSADDIGTLIYGAEVLLSRIGGPVKSGRFKL